MQARKNCRSDSDDLNFISAWLFAFQSMGKVFSCSITSHDVSSQKMARQRKAPPSLGEWLRQMREGKELPLRVVAAAAEMDQAHLSKAELGQRLLTAEQAAA